MNQPTEINPEAWRLSMSGYSIVAGYSDDRKTIAQMPVTSTREEIGRWTTLALEIVDEHNARIAELEAERDALRAELVP